MASSGAFNTRSAAVRRLLKEAKEMAENPSPLLRAAPLEDNLFEWHFVIAGPDDSEFQGGLYHGRIILPPEYPLKPPSIIIMTPNGRFETNKKLCLSISGYHPESWQPSWSIRTALLALIGFMPTLAKGALGGVDYPPEERRRLARLSRDWTCKSCCGTSNVEYINIGLLNNSNNTATPDESAEKLRSEREEAERLGTQIQLNEPTAAAAAAATTTTAATTTLGDSEASGDAVVNTDSSAAAAPATTATTTLTAEQIRQRQRDMLNTRKAEFQRRFQNLTSNAAGGNGNNLSSSSSAKPWWFYAVAVMTLSIIGALFLRRILLFLEA